MLLKECVPKLWLANDPVFLDAAVQFPEAIAKAGEALRYVPQFLAT